MSQERTEAVVLRGVDFSESSRIVTFLTPRRGRMACMAKGVRRAKSPLAPLLDTFNRVELVYYWKEGRSVQQVGETVLREGYAGIKARLDKVTLAAFVLELASKVAHENEPSETLYAALVTGLDRLQQWEGDPRTHAAWQTLRLLAAAGYAPLLTECAECGGPIRDNPGFRLSAGMTCGGCGRDRALTRDEAACLRSLGHDASACPEMAGPASIFTLLTVYAARQLETDFRSTRVIEEMLNR